MNKVDYDIVIIGAGMVGASLASLLSRGGFSVALVEAREPDVFDAKAGVGLRVSAISPGSAAILNQAGAWKAIEASRCRAYRRMQVEDDQNTEPLLFDAPAYNLERLGTIIENALMQRSLWDVVVAGGMVELFCPEQLDTICFAENSNTVTLKSGQELSASLVVGADGGGSMVRKAAGIGQDLWSYNQHGLVAVVGKQKPNPGVAWQRFLPTGPLAFLPLEDGRSSIVWTLPSAESARLLKLDDDAFMTELDQASGGWLGAVTSCGPKAAFPLNMRLSERYVAQRTVLLGDAAHVVHPLAGQGVNLGYADAAVLADTLICARFSGKDIGSTRVLRAYERQRRADSEAMAFAMHALRSLFAIDALSPVRRLGLSVVRHSWPIKDMFIQKAAGLGKHAPRLATGTSIQHLAQSL